MTLASSQTPGRPYPWNRNDKGGLALSILAPTLAVIAENALIFATGWRQTDPAYAMVAFNPPGWLVGLVWVIIYPMWGAARWYAHQSGLAGRRRSRWVSALMLWGLAYPLLTAGGGIEWSALANLISLLLAVVTAFQVRGVSKRSFWLVAPSLAWLSFATLLGFTALMAAGA